jgi:hypothetical protein
MRTGASVFQAIERIVYGRPGAQALREEVERLQARVNPRRIDSAEQVLQILEAAA